MIEQFFESLDDCLSRLSIFRKNIILKGGFNTALNCDEPHTGTFCSLLRVHGLFVTNVIMTRRDRCLDSVATNLDTWAYEVDFTRASGG